MADLPPPAPSGGGAPHNSGGALRYYGKSLLYIFVWGLPALFVLLPLFAVGIAARFVWEFTCTGWNLGGIWFDNVLDAHERAKVDK